MGKKNKKAKSVAAETDSGMPRHVRREVLEIVNQLLDSEHLGLFHQCLILSSYLVSVLFITSYCHFRMIVVLSILYCWKVFLSLL